jgi:hypothetical protein
MREYVRTTAAGGIKGIGGERELGVGQLGKFGESQEWRRC